jgi:hypothetical protein
MGLAIFCFQTARIIFVMFFLRFKNRQMSNVVLAVKDLLPAESFMRKAGAEEEWTLPHIVCGEEKTRQDVDMVCYIKVFYLCRSYNKENNNYY